MSNYNNLVVQVIQAKGLRLGKHHHNGGEQQTSPPPPVFVSLSTSGKSKWKSKVTTNGVEPSHAGGNCEWREHCEFELNELDAELHVHVCTRNKLGLTETLGSVIFHLERMSRYQGPTWYRLKKRHDDVAGEAVKQRGHLQLEYQFSNRIPSSISSLSLSNQQQTQKHENRLDKLRHKIHQSISGKKAAKASSDATSLTSVSASMAGISRRSSQGSINSGLAFSSPSPTRMLGSGAMLGSQPHQYDPNLNEQRGHFHSALSSQQQQHQQPPADPSQPHQNSGIVQPAGESPMVEVRLEEPDSAPLGDFPNRAADSSPTKQHSPAAATTIQSLFAGKAGVAKKGLGLMSLGGGQAGHHNGGGGNKMATSGGSRGMRGKGRGDDGGNSKEYNGSERGGSGASSSRPGSLASSGFASHCSTGNLDTLNESTSPAHLLNVIRHLRRELITKEQRIRDLEDYTDQLLSKVILTHPELLHVTAGLNQPSPPLIIQQHQLLQHKKSAQCQAASSRRRWN